MNNRTRELICRAFESIEDLSSLKAGLIFSEILGDGWNDPELKGLPYTRKEADCVYATDEELIEGIEQLLPKLEWVVDVYKTILNKWYNEED